MAVEVLRALGQSRMRRAVVVRWNGPLAPEFAANSDRMMLEPLRRTRVMLRYFRRTRPAANALEQVVAGLVLLLLRPSVLYLNTVKSASYVRPALLLRKVVFLHCHELEPLASQTLARYRLQRCWRRVNLIACSEAVRDNLARITGLEPERIAILTSTIDPDRVLSMSLGDVQPATGGGAKPFTVGACGLANHGKGVDLWVDVARRVCAQRPKGDVQFVWVGEGPTRETIGQVKELGLEDVVAFVGNQANPYPWLASFDIHVLPSRQDSFPLVVLEAMALGRPVVAFDVGGVAQQLADCGRLVPPEDTAGMAQVVLELLDDSAQRAKLGDAARERLLRLFTVDRFETALRALLGTEVT